MLPFKVVSALGLALKVLWCVLQVLTFKLSATCSAPTCVIFWTGKLLLIGNRDASAGRRAVLIVRKCMMP